MPKCSQIRRTTKLDCIDKQTYYQTLVLEGGRRRNCMRRQGKINKKKKITNKTTRKRTIFLTAGQFRSGTYHCCVRYQCLLSRRRCFLPHLLIYKNKTKHKEETKRKTPKQQDDKKENHFSKPFFLFTTHLHNRHPPPLESSSWSFRGSSAVVLPSSYMYQFDQINLVLTLSRYI